MDPSRLEEPIRVEVRTDLIRMNMNPGEPLFQQGRCEVESDEKCQVWRRTVAGELFSPVLLVSARGFNDQVLFYANSGPPYPSTDVSGGSSGGYVSLFLSCEVRRVHFCAR